MPNIFLWLMIACSSEIAENKEVAQEKINTEEKRTTEKRPRVIILGDSLTAGMGLPLDAAYPKLLEKRLKEAKLPTEIVNAGQSGDTTAGGLRRIDWLLSQKPDLLVIELGANDGMRGIPLDEVRANISAMIEKAQQANVPVKLVDMRIPPNYGEEYTSGFQAIYVELAERYQIELLPFLLQEVGGKKELNQADGIHPTQEGHQQISSRLYEPFKTWREQLIE